ncbi:Gfo/Idh/MocA family oxidoreductase [Paenibacillus sp. RC67]|uniref:Gfo/Idh/MocA family protein n=1 Tax=Paenibacillus sp. RC67 TaxID=3039392 RepID=UPI0024ADFABF|nr:Gfo/Idh/MocA family oxidoreductase [Paenibacillus sp. RC67]
MTKGVSTPLSAVLIGAGQRCMIYASYAEKHPEQLHIAAVVEPDAERRKLAADRFGIEDDRCFDTVAQLIALPKLADAAINGTMDELHVQTTIPLLEAGYDVLLEKPIGVTEEEVLELKRIADANGRKVMICHVLRYAPFYTAIRERIAAGEIGEVVNIQTSEHVSYHHMAVSFIRGKWGSQEKCKSSMLMAKCCHDLDLITWLNGDARPVKVSSFGSLSHFRSDKAPAGAGTRCLTDCSIEESCPYSAKKNYIEQGRWGFYVWNNHHLGARLSTEDKLESLRTVNPYGRCVWHCDNDVVDRQSVIIEFDNGSTASHNMIGATPKACRILHIIGTKGEIEGVMEDGHFVVRHPDPRPGQSYTEEHVKLDVKDDGHGGGDLRLVEDFVKMLSGDQTSVMSTTLDQSISGHRIGFAAERSRLEGQVILL